MSNARKNWIWFAALALLVVGAGIQLGRCRRPELGESFAYDLGKYRKVDPALIRYAETGRIDPGFAAPSALAVAPDGRIHVGGTNVVAVFSPDGKRLQSIPVAGVPTCLAVDDDNNLYTGLRDHVEIVRPDGGHVDWPAPAANAYLTSIAVDDQYVFVADAGDRLVWRYAKSGGEPFAIGRKDPAKGVRGFYVPSPFFDIAVGNDGSLWAVNPGYHAFENYRPDGTPISSWERSAMTIDGFSGCCNPAHFALLPDGGFVTAEKGLPRVKIHNVDGSLRCVVAAPDRFAQNDEGLGVAVDPAGRILVLDPAAGAIRIFEEKK